MKSLVFAIVGSIILTGCMSASKNFDNIDIDKEVAKLNKIPLYSMIDETSDGDHSITMKVEIDEEKIIALLNKELIKNGKSPVDIRITKEFMNTMYANINGEDFQVKMHKYEDNFYSLIGEYLYKSYIK